jgi:hypothetical protein
MSITCHATGLWDQVRSAPYYSKQEWQASNLLILCQILINQGIQPNMSYCTVAGLWDQIRGNPPYLSDQEFYAENINLLCQIAGSPGLSGNTQVIYENHSPDTPGGDFTIIYIQWKVDCNALWIWLPPAASPPIGQWVQFDFEKGLGKYTVPTIVELRAIPTIGDCPPVEAKTFGNLVVGDPQAAHYRFDPDVYDADNGMSVIMPNDRTIADPGRWMQFSPA